MDEAKGEKERPDPLAGMVEFYDNWAKAWAKTMSETASSPRFVEAMSQQMEGGLELWALVRDQVGASMEQMMKQVKVPTHDDFAGLAERLTAIEMRLDDIEDKLDQALARMTGS